MTHRAVLAAVMALLLSTLSLFTTGCAAPAGGTSASGSTSPDMETASDETDLRRRARLRLELASGYFEQGQTTVALDELKQALLIDPTLAEAHNLRGLVYMRLEDPRLAEESFRRASTLAPRDPDIAHNFGWLLCSQARYAEAKPYFALALSVPTYLDKAKTWMAQGLCELRAGAREEGERSLARAYELDPGNPIAAYNLSKLLLDKDELVRAQFYIRRLNNSNLANAESLWLGIKIERRLDNREAARQLADQLRKRFSESREVGLLERGAFNE